jgi:hypothetical protein
MKNMTRKFLAAGLIASALTFVGCKSDTSGEREDDTTQGTTTTPTEGTSTDTGTQTPPGTGGSGTENISKTKQSDDNLRMPYEDPLRTPEPESIRDAEREDERGVHDEDPGTGGSGFESEPTDEPLDQGGNVDGINRDSDNPSDVPSEDDMMEESQIPEGAR